jgi:hypothetical protein
VRVERAMTAPLSQDLRKRTCGRSRVATQYNLCAEAYPSWRGRLRAVGEGVAALVEIGRATGGSRGKSPFMTQRSWTATPLPIW